jgi:lysophospholipase L1-like esterase
MFHGVLVMLAAAAWALLAWLASHRSDTPTVLARYSPAYAGMLAVMLGLALAVSTLLVPRVRARLEPRLGDLLLLGISLATPLVAAELAVRWLDPLGISYFDESRRYRIELVADDVLVYRHRPNWSVHAQGVTIRTNEAGMRDSRPVTAKRPGELRILMLGDSVVLGWGVEEAQIFPRRLETILADTLRQPVRVLNAGVSSYNTEQYLRYLQLHGAALAPDLVLMVSVVNDDDVQARPFVLPDAKPLSELSPPQVVTRFLEKSRLVRVVAFYAHAFSGVHDVAAPASPGWKSALQAYEDFGRHCARSGLRCASFFIRMARTPKTDAFVTEQAARAQRLGLSFTDMLPWFEGHDWRRLVNSAVDPHPNAEGHRIIAENMARTLFPR